MGGAEKVVLDLAKYTSKGEFSTFVLALSKRDELLEDFLSNDIKTTILRKSNSLKDFIRIVKSTNKFVKINSIQIVHAHMTHSIIVASIVKIFNPSLKIIYTSHSLNIGSKTREIIIWSLKLLRDIDIVFSKDILKFFYKKNYIVISNGVKVDRYNFNLEKNKKFTFIAVGRLEAVKNHMFLVEIANELKGKYDFEIQIVGDGYLKEDLRVLIKKYSLGNYIKLLGLRDDIPILLNRSHCLLMPSLWEGLPIAILEAGASSLPVISTPVGSIPSLLNNKNSYLANLDQFKGEMIEVLENYKISKNKGKELFKNISESYSVDDIVRKHEKLYRELIC
jgi:glycosyltransferase involved in cell wall biosynthesis